MRSKELSCKGNMCYKKYENILKEKMLLKKKGKHLLNEYAVGCYRNSPSVRLRLRRNLKNRCLSFTKYWQKDCYDNKS